MRIEGEAAVVTGGASGLGEASARRLAAAGARVAILDRDAGRGARVAHDIGGVFAPCDVTDADAVEHAFAGAERAHGPARILVACAGIVAGERVASRDKTTGAPRAHAAATFQRVIAVNLVGTFLCASRAASAMLSLDPREEGERGVLVLTASIAAEDGQMGQVAYAASKGGVLAMTLPMARDLAREGVRVVSILPGLFHTPMFDSLTPEVRASLAATVPFPPRLGDPAEYAALVQHICENRMLNGSGLRLDGALRLAPR